MSFAGGGGAWDQLVGHARESEARRLERIIFWRSRTPCARQQLDGLTRGVFGQARHVAVEGGGQLGKDEIKLPSEFVKGQLIACEKGTYKCALPGGICRGPSAARHDRGHVAVGG